MRGAELPDQWIIRGNHHDAWVNGAKDPISGMVAMMEEARAIGELAKTGWKPKRTMVFAAWDAEEPGLLGSTEWVEHHAEELRKHAVAYINTDSNGRGFWDAGGSHSLERFINRGGARRARSADERAMSDAGARAGARRSCGDQPTTRRRRGRATDLRIDALGSGSDYTPFLQHLGVASLNIGFSGEDNGGSYHSIYDSFDHYNRFGDPGFAYGVALAKAGGRAMLRLANADVLPFQFGPLAETIDRYLKEVTKLAPICAIRRRRRIAGSRTARCSAVADPNETFVVAGAEGAGAVPQLHRSAERARSAAAAGARLRRAQRKLIAGGTVSTEVRQATGALLVQAERALTQREGPAAAAVVHASDLRAGLLHRLWREDAAGRARGDRAASVEGIRAAGRGDGGSHRSPGRAPAPRDGSARREVAQIEANYRAACYRGCRRRVDVAPELIVVVLDPVPSASVSVAPCCVSVCGHVE